MNDGTDTGALPVGVDGRAETAARHTDCCTPRSRRRVREGGGRIGTFGLIGAVAAAVVCCAGPVLVSSGVVATAVGWGTGAWLAILFGFSLVVVAVRRWVWCRPDRGRR